VTRAGRRDRPRRVAGSPRPPGHVALARALSKLGLASRSEAITLVLAGRVRVNGRIQRDPGRLVVPERITVAIDEVAADPPPMRTIAFHKPRGVMTTRRDPEGRPTVQALIAGAGDGLSAVGRLDQASTGLLLCTTDTQLAAWLTAPDSAVEREYAVTVRGRVAPADAERLVAGVVIDGQRCQAAAVRVRKASGRESHLMVVLTEGKNREIRRLCAAIGHEVTRLHRIRIGGIRLEALAPGAWRIISEEMLAAAFPGYSVQRSRPPDRTPAARRPRNRGGSL
jgi:23S rRNA pseudouridine2605 synthase